jgi:hypothetical protein
MSNRTIILVLLSMLFLSACSPEAGSQAWCEDMDEKATGDWSANEAGEYATSCVFRSKE